MKKKNVLLLIVSVLLVTLVTGCSLFNNNNKSAEKTDSEKFGEEYTEVGKDNLYVYRDFDQIVNILEKGTGIVYIGFPECPWCQRYAKYLNEVATDLGIEKIYYYNILQDRKANDEVVEKGIDNVSEETKTKSNNYLKIVSLIEKYLQNNEEGNKRVYVPSIIALKKGEIVGFDDETAWDTKGFQTPDEYWTKEEIKDLKEKLEKMIADTEMNMCTECN